MVFLRLKLFTSTARQCLSKPLLAPVQYARNSQRLFSGESVLSGSSANYVDQMHAAWKEDPSSVHLSWQVYFNNLEAGVASAGAWTPPPTLTGQPLPASVGESGDTARTLHLIAAYQRRGHEMAKLDPVGLQERPVISDLDYRTYGFTENDLERGLHLGATVVNVDGLMGNADVNQDGKTTLSELVDFLNQTYCSSVGVEAEHLADLEKLNWLRSRIEVHPKPFTKEEKSKMLERLAFSEKFEAFCATKFSTAKRFGVEGLESLVPGMKTMVDSSTAAGVTDIIIGMPHRGRLNVLTNVMRKPLEIIFKEFKGTDQDIALEDKEGDWSMSGDVKYHLGTSMDRSYPDGRQVQLVLLPNPSHLETVNPVVAGKAHARMHLRGDKQGKTVMPVILHGDAAFAGQGVVYETMQMTALDAYHTGGTINIICNNQVGFTANPSQARSTMYASDLGKAFGCPIFHVNADDVEAVCRVFALATEWRNEFHTDVVIDLIGYRKHGHNEIDEPTFTQPLMYQKIKKHPTPMTVYANQLLQEGSLTAAEVEGITTQVDAIIQKAFEESATYPGKHTWEDENWASMKTPLEMTTNETTGVSLDTLHAIGKALYSTPDGFTVHNKLKKNLKGKQTAMDTAQGIDWATGEALAWGSLLLEGNDVRLTGQDVERGTFSHRHALIHDQKTGEKYTFLNHMKEGQPKKLTVENSFLSEYGVLGFEVGYSWESPHALVMWEAQFGDFVNGAQIMVDQYICSAETKWMRQSGLVMLLPHGYQGAGPEHSSCRIERFLQCSDDDPDILPSDLHTLDGQMQQVQRTNWQIMNLSTPANYFHALRRQLHREFRKPLIMAAPKAQLRHRLAVSELSEFGPDTRFHRVYDEMYGDELVAPDKVRRIVMCSGKIYFELLEARRSSKVDDVALVRVEQLCPFPYDRVAQQMKSFPNAKIVWAQEEPKNMGAWYFVQDRIMAATRVLNGQEIRPAYVGRKTMASSAEGYGAVHTYEQNKLVEVALSHDVSAYGHGITKK